jgi:hypothetical protein
MVTASRNGHEEVDDIATQHFAVAPPNFQTIEVEIRGTAPYVQHAFSEKMRKEMLGRQIEGSTAQTKRKRDARDIDGEFKAAAHVAEEGWYGIPAPAFRAALIDACRMVGYKMTHARMSVFVIADGIDRNDGTPLVRIRADEPEMAEDSVRLATGVASIAIRARWRQWGAILKLRFDRDQFTPLDVINLLHRAGIQVGIGEGRPYSKKSNGLGWGTFEIVEQ